MKELYRKLSTITTHELGLVMNYDLSVVGVAILDFAPSITTRIEVPHLLVANPQETPLMYWARFLAFLYNNHQDEDTLYQSKDEGWLFVFRDQEEEIVNAIAPHELSVFYEVDEKEILVRRDQLLQLLPENTYNYFRPISEALETTTVTNLWLLPDTFHSPPDGRNRLYYSSANEIGYSQYLSVMTEYGNQGVLVDMDPKTKIVWDALYEWLASLMFSDPSMDESNEALFICSFLRLVNKNSLYDLDVQEDPDAPKERFLVILTQADPVMRYLCAKPTGALYHLHVLEIDEDLEAVQARLERIRQLVRNVENPKLMSFLARVFFHRVNRDHATTCHGFKAYQELNLKLLDQTLLRFPLGVEPVNALAY